MRRLRDILNTMLNNSQGPNQSSRIKGAARLNLNAEDEIFNAAGDKSQIRTER